MVNVKDNYPMSEKSSHMIRTATGKSYEEITLEKISDGLTKEDFSISKESLMNQAEISESAGYPHLANNFRQGAELIEIPEDRLLQMYNAMRPYTSTKDELQAIVKELRETYDAKLVADFYQEAVDDLVKTKRLKGDR